MAIDAEGLIGQLQHFAQYEMLRENLRDEMIHLQVERYRCLGREGFSFLFGVNGSPMAASMTDLANRFGSVGFLAGRFFFCFVGIDYHAILIFLCQPHRKSNHTSTRLSHSC